jgi:hypothetical protein
VPFFFATEQPEFSFAFALMKNVHQGFGKTPTKLLICNVMYTSLAIKELSKASVTRTGVIQQLGMLKLSVFFFSDARM